MDDIRSTVPVVYEQREVGRFPEVGDPARFFDRSSREFRFHKLYVGAIVSDLLRSVGIRNFCGGSSIGGVVYRALVPMCYPWPRRSSHSCWRCRLFIVCRFAGVTVRCAISGMTFLDNSEARS